MVSSSRDRGRDKSRETHKRRSSGRHARADSVRSKADDIVEELMRDVAALGAPLDGDALAAAAAISDSGHSDHDDRGRRDKKAKRKHRKHKEEEKLEASTERVSKKAKKKSSKDKDKSSSSKKKRRKHKSDYGPAPAVASGVPPVKSEPLSDREHGDGSDSDDDKKPILTETQATKAQFSGVLDAPDGPSLADIEFVVPSSAITESSDSQAASTFVPLSQRFGKSKAASAAATNAKARVSSPAVTKKFTLDEQDMRICVASADADAANKSADDGDVVVRPKIMVKAQKLSDFMRQRGHEDVGTAAEAADKADAADKPSADSSKSSDKPLLPAPPAPPPRSAMQLEPFPLAKQGRPRIPILKSATGQSGSGSPDQPSFVPRNVSLKQKPPQEQSDATPPVMQPPEQEDASSMTVANKSRQKMKAQVEEAKSRLAGVFDFDDQFKPPLRKKKHLPKLSDDESEASVPVATKPLPSKDEQKRRKTHIVIQSVKKSSTIMKAPAAATPKRPDEEGEIVDQDDDHDDDADDDDKATIVDDTEGELHDDSDDDTRSVASSLFPTPAKSRIRPRGATSIRRPSAKPKPSKPTKDDRKRGKADERRDRRSESRRRSRSRSLSRVKSSRPRSRSPSRRRSTSRRRSMSRSSRRLSRSRSPSRRRPARPGDRNPIDYRRRQPPEPSERDKELWPWGKGPKPPPYKRRYSRTPPPETDKRRTTGGDSRKSASPGARRSSPSRKRSREATPTPRDADGRIDKKKLFEIARKNASAMLQMGTLQQMRNMSADEIARLKAGGRSVDELVDYCKKLQRREEKELLREAGEPVSEDESVHSGEEMDEEKLVNHPFAVKAPTGIRINIPNAIPIPTKTPFQRKQEEASLRLTFPVSSGQQHRTKESTWMPVRKEPVLGDRVARSATGEQLALTGPTGGTSAAAGSGSGGASNSDPPAAAAAPAPKPPGMGPLPLAPDSSASMAASASSAPNIGPQGMPVGAPNVVGFPMLPPPPVPPSHSAAAISAQLAQADKVFSESTDPELSVNDIVSRRVRAMRQLQDNPHDVQALKVMHECEQQMKQWAQAKNLPGQFTGSTGVSILSADQLRPADPKYEAWAKKDMLARATPVDSGFGMSMLLKLGWRPGEGLGRERTGQVEPLLLDIKSDRKGLVAVDELPGSRNRPGGGTFAQTLAGKHPVSILTELCQRRRWGPPQFSVIESGPTHARRYLWKVVVNGVEYQPAVPSNNKKSGKTQSASTVLQSLGLVPKDNGLPVVIG